MDYQTATVVTVNPSPAARSAGVVMALASLLSVALMLHHPSVGSHSVSDVLGEIAEKSMTSRVVHGFLIALVGALIHTFVEFSRRLDLHRAPVRAALIAYAIGSCAMIGAALISGFLIPDLAAQFVHARPDDLGGVGPLLILCGLGNRTLANFAVIAMSVGILLWSWATIRSNRDNAWIGAIGLVAGAAPAVALLLGLYRLDVVGMTSVVVCQTLWNLAVASAMIRGKV